MVRDGEDAVKAIRKQEFDNEVHSDVFKGEGGAISGDRAVWCVGVSHNGFGGLAGGTMLRPSTRCSRCRISVSRAFVEDEDTQRSSLLSCLTRAEPRRQAWL